MPRRDRGSINPSIRDRLAAGSRSRKLNGVYGHSACQPIVCFIPSPGIILIIPRLGRLWHDDAAKNDGRHEGKK